MKPIHNAKDIKANVERLKPYQFSSTNQPSNESKRKPKTVTAARAFQAFFDQLVDTGDSKRVPVRLMNCLLKKLKKEMLREDVPFANFIKAFEFSMDRAYGKASQTVDMNVTNEVKEYSEYSTDELMSAMVDIANEIMFKGIPKEHIIDTINAQADGIIHMHEAAPEDEDSTPLLEHQEAEIIKDEDPIIE